MKPEPDPQSGGKRPKPRRGFAKENRAEEALEKDLWDLDEPMPGTPPAPDAADAEESSAEESGKDKEVRTTLPITPRSTRRDLVFKQSSPKKWPHAPADEAESSRPSTEETADGFSNRVTASAASDEAFGDLEQSSAGPTGSEDEPEPVAETVPSAEEAVEDLEKEAPADSPAHPENQESREPAASASTSEEVSSKRLSNVERMGLAGFLALVVGGLLFFLAYSVNKIPEDPKPLTPGDLPIAGKIISADKISSYWREPDISAGETVRRGTLLLPVVELGVSGGPGAVRVLFRDSDGAIIGDGVTRPVNGEGTVTIVATAGFDDQGMFAAYRTGETKPWKIEVLEGTSENASGNEFKKIFEIPISTQRR